jgi:predicted GIY-YIG superfamily endonuclease
VPCPIRKSVGSQWMVYVLRCRDGSLYTGITNNLPKRINAHAAGKASKYTRSRLPVAVVFQEAAGSKSAALRREAAIKQLPRRRKDQLLAESRRARVSRKRVQHQRAVGKKRPQSA